MRHAEEETDVRNADHEAVLLRRHVKHAKRTRDIKVTRTACMGRCGEGPTVTVYPDGVWYQRVTPADIVQECLANTATPAAEDAVAAT